MPTSATTEAGGRLRYATTGFTKQTILQQLYGQNWVPALNSS